MAARVAEISGRRCRSIGLSGGLVAEKQAVKEAGTITSRHDSFGLPAGAVISQLALDDKQGDHRLGMASHQQPSQTLKTLVEEKTYRIGFDEGAPLVRQAIEHATGITLSELAPGMWSGTKRADDHSRLEVTVRALRADEGMNVEVRLEHHFTGKAIAAFGIAIALGCLIILPLIPAIWMSVRLQRKHVRDRLVEMHKVWNEIGEAVGAPRRAGYREQPERAYAPVRVAEEESKRAKLEAAALEESESREAESELRRLGGG